jgi:cytochrome c553
MNARGIFLIATIVAAIPAAAQPAAPPGATSCSGCHAPASSPGVASAPLRGRAPDDIVTAMRAFRSGERAATVMDRIAKGFSDDEVRAIAAWYSAQR